VAKPELGTKRVCGSCGAKFYDLSKDPIVCPKCGTVFEVIVPVTRARADAAAAARAMPPAAVVKEPELETTETENAEFVSLEDADAEAQGKKPAAETAEGDDEIEVADDESMDDEAFIEEQEEGDADVTDIIGDAGEKEEET
jgi:uncharacterized protein (TIGR02300 family)